MFGIREGGNPPHCTTTIKDHQGRYGFRRVSGAADSYLTCALHRRRVVQLLPRRSPKTSPCASTRSSTSSYSSWSRPSSAPCSISCQARGAATYGRFRPRREYGEIVVFAPVFWLQSRKTLPPRRDLVIFQSTRSGCSAVSSWAISCAWSRTPSAFRLPGRAAYMCRPLLPEVTGADERPRSSSLSRTSRATSQHSC